MTTTVFLVRHGAHDRLGKVLCGRMPGVVLSAEGRTQAWALAQRLKGEGLSAIYVSPLVRARETAEPLAAATRLPLTEDEDLDEIAFGAWTGQPFEGLHGDADWRLWNTARSLARPPGGESMTEVQARLVRWLHRIRATHEDQKVAAFTHSDVIKALAAHVLGFSVDQHERLEVSPASVSTLVAGDWGAKLLCLNEGLR